MQGHRGKNSMALTPNRYEDQWDALEDTGAIIAYSRIKFDKDVKIYIYMVGRRGASSTNAAENLL